MKKVYCVRYENLNDDVVNFAVFGSVEKAIEMADKKCREFCYWFDFDEEDEASIDRTENSGNNILTLFADETFYIAVYEEEVK